MSKIKPILFNTDMVRAILDGTKTVTRRVVKPQPPNAHMVLDYDEDDNSFDFMCGAISDGLCIDFAYTAKASYRIGDILYVRETWRLVDFDYIDGNWSANVSYKADCGIGPRLRYLPHGSDERCGWRPSIHMPRESARIFLRVTDVRVERLQDITEEQALSEGARKEYQHYYDNVVTAREFFSGIWNSTIKPADRACYRWDANPWVWVIEFERCEKPEGD